MSIYLSKSKYCKGKQCPKMLWLEKYKPEEAEEAKNESVLKKGNQIGEIAKGMFGEHIDIQYNEDLNIMIEETKKHMQNKPNIITEASFSYNNNFCSVDILKNLEDGVEIYEVKSSARIKEIYKDDIAYQVYILRNAGLNVKSANLIHVNSKYIRHGELELNKLLVIEDMTTEVMEKQDEVKNMIEELEKYMENDTEPSMDISENCFKPYGCPFWKYCTKELPEKNVFTLRNVDRSKKIDFYSQGIISYDDLLEKIKNKKAKQQIVAELNDEEFIDTENIHHFLEKLTYPLYFLDFESFQQIIPQYDGVSAYMQVPFQYSIHYIENEEGEIKHKEFLAEAGVDPRRLLAERLVNDIPQSVCVIAYNMSFERGVIADLAEMFPDLREHLLNIRNNIKDLMTPFLKRWFYIKEMEGAYSIKAVLPALYPDVPEYDYKNLEMVHNGEEACETFNELIEKTKEEQENIRKALLKYCELDTLAMVKIWQKLKEV